MDPEVITRISRLELRARMIVEGFVSGLHKSPYHGFSVEFASHREYVAGDDIRHIDWRLFGRGDRLYIKQYEEETNLRTQILLDSSRSMAYPEHPGPGWRNKYDYAATAAASLIYLLLHQQDACGLVLFDEGIREAIPPSSQPARLISMIEQIEQNPPAGRTDVDRLYAQLADRIRRRGLIVLISDLLTDTDAVLRGIQQLRYERHDVIVLHVLDRDELTFPFEGNMMFEDLEWPDRRILADPSSLRASYLEIVQRFITKVRSACANHQIDYVLLSTDEPVDAALTAYLAARRHRNQQ